MNETNTADTVNVLNPSGELVSIPKEVYGEALNQGYSEPTSEDLHNYAVQEKYGGTGQTLIGAAEQVAKGALGPLAPAIERGIGIPAEEIRGREEAQGAGAKFLEQGAGLLGSSFIPVVGQAGLLEKVGQGALKALGIGEATSVIGRIGTQAAKMAVENAAFQSGDELSKMIVHDPDQSAGTALTDIGISALIGGGFGGTLGAGGALWSSTVGKKIEPLLRAISNRVNGETLPISQDLGSVIETLEKKGHEVAPEIKSGLSQLPEANNYFKNLIESGTGSGDAMRQTLEKFQGDVKNHLEGTFRENGEMTAHQAGDAAKEAISQKADQLHDVISDKYSQVIPHLDAIQIPDKPRLKFYDQMIKDGQNFGANGSPAQGIFKGYAERALAQDTVGQLKKLTTEISSEYSVARRAGDFEKARALGDVRSSIKDFMDRQIVNSGKQLEKEGFPNGVELSKSLVRDKQIADEMYKNFKDQLSELSSAGKLGKIRTHGELMDALDRIPSATLADKLFNTKNIEGLKFLKKEFPEVFDAIAKAKKTSIIDAASKTGEVQHNKILNSVNSLPKEVRGLLFKPEELNMINASGQVLRQSFKRINPSGTARTLDSLKKHMPAGIGAVISTILGHGPIGGIVAGEVAQALGRDVPDAAKAALLKFLGSSEPIDGTAFKVLHDYVVHIDKGRQLIKKAASAAIKSGSEVLPKSKVPDENDRKKLLKQIDNVKDGKTSLLDSSGKLDHYATEHATSLTNQAANVIQYLDSIKPQEVKPMLFDKPMSVSADKKANFDTALDIAIQPLVVAKSIQNGTLTPQEMKHLQIMHPAVYSSMVQEFMGMFTDHVLDNDSVAYKQRLSLSLFLGQPLDSTISPQSILAAQPRPPQAQMQVSQGRSQKGSMRNINKIAQGAATANQNREMQKSGIEKA